MKISPQELRESAIAIFSGQTLTNCRITQDFIEYINAYCYELKKTEWDILHDEETFQIVYSIFDSICDRKIQMV